jgi:arylsulfatase A-like enzyme
MLQRMHRLALVSTLGALLLGLLGLLGLLCACTGSTEEPPARSALLISLDTTRADALTGYGGEEGVTPNLDRLAAEGVLFERAYATAPLTTPSHASMLTGLYPPRHGVRDNGHQVLADEVPTLAEAASRAKLQTAAFISSAVLHAEFGLAQGFHLYDAPEDLEARGSGAYPSRRAHDTVDRTLAWLANRDRSRGFFLWVHLWDPHLPHEAPPRFRQRTPYLSEVASADDAVGNLLAGLRAEGVLDETLIVVVGDHGEGNGDHGEATHGAFCYDSTLRVPLLVRHPDGSGAGTRVAGTTSVADIYPTVLHALGLGRDATVDGRPLSVAGGDGRGVYFESYYGYFTYGWSHLAGWVDDEGKYLHGPRPVLFDLRNDPGETTNLAEERGAGLERYRSAIARIAALPSHAPEAGDDLSEELRAGIRALGYGGGLVAGETVPGPLEPSPRPWPLDCARELERMGLANALLGERRHAEAAVIYEDLVARNGRNLWCRKVLALCYLHEERYADAVPQFRAVVEGGKADVGTYNNLGGCLLRVGEPELALECFLRVLELAPNRKMALESAVLILEAQGRDAEAAPWRQRYRDVFGEELP